MKDISIKLYNTKRMGDLKQNQQGIAAIVVTTILILVIGLIIFSFAEVSRTNQNEALVNQLGQQAYDAAETAVDIVHNHVSASAKLGTLAPETKDCNNLDPGYSGSAYKNDVGGGGILTGADSNIVITCALVNPQPTSLTNDAVPVNSSVVWELKPSVGQPPIGQLLFTWQGDTSLPNGSCNSPFGIFPTADKYKCNIPMLHVDLFQNNGGAFSSLPQSLNNNTLTLFLQPTKNTNTTANNLPNNFATQTYVAPGSGGSNPRLVTCDTIAIDPTTSKNICSMLIYINRGSAPPSVEYFIRIAPMYQVATNLTLTPFDQNGNPVELADSQAVIDVTAKDHNEARRIQVRVNIDINPGSTNGLELPNNALESGSDICKLLDANGTGGTDFSNC